MRKWKAWLFALAVLIGIGTIGTVSVTAEAQNLNQGKRVLFISSYSYGWDTVQTQIEGIKAGVDENTTVDYEFMDTKRFRTKESTEMFYTMLKYHLDHSDPYDVVIVGDDAALRFAMAFREDLFDGIPIVFEGVNDEEYALEAAKNPLVTGILEKLSVEKNIDMALKVNPSADKVVAILDDSVTGEAERKNFYSAEAKYPELEFSEINSSELTTAKLQQAVSKVDENTILIYIVMSNDGSGKQYTNAQAIRMLVTYSKVPVYRMVEAGIGDGLLGGNVVSMYKSGEIAAQMAMDIANGTDSAEINVVKDSPNIYCVDEDVMRKFGLEASQFPKDTEFVNHREGFFARNREALIPALILIAALNVIICWVCFDNYRRRKLLQELEQARAIMESASQHDFLTGLPNRSKFMKDLEQLIEARIPCTVMMLDIDNFKKINDTYGHTAGDEALQQVANRLKDMQSQILTSYRFAGDEFILILRSSQSMLVEKTAYQCRQVFAKDVTLCGTKRRIGGSIGIASYPKDTDNLEQLIDSNEEERYKDENELKGKIEEIFERELIQAEALNFIRGRSLIQTYLIIDEAQNTTPNQIKGIITRAGKNTKIILLGDPNQIDRPFLDERTNGLSYAAEHMKGSSLCWQITMSPEECERSELAMDAIQRLEKRTEKKEYR